MLSIAGRIISPGLILAPLAGYGDLPFRLLCREFGAPLCVSEMISSHGLVYRQPRTLDMLRSSAGDRPVSFQLFGSEADILGEAAAMMAGFEPDFIDINMGCPVRKVTKRGAGAALMSDIGKAEQVVRAVVANSPCPVTVKMRSGPDSKTICASEFSIMAEACGAAAVAIHGRTWKQGFAGAADWGLVAAVKKRVSIPVIGNGDLSTHAEALAAMETAGCDAVMIGRAAIGNPWIFDPAGRPDNLAAIVAGVIRHLELIEAHQPDPNRGLAAVKNHLGRYFRGFPGCASIRKAVYEAPGWSALNSLLKRVGDGNDAASA